MLPYYITISFLSSSFHNLINHSLSEVCSYFPLKLISHYDLLERKEKKNHIISYITHWVIWNLEIKKKKSENFLSILQYPFVWKDFLFLFCRSLIVEGLKQHNFRLLRNTWMGWPIMLMDWKTIPMDWPMMACVGKEDPRTILNDWSINVVDPSKNDAPYLLTLFWEIDFFSTKILSRSF